VVIPESGILTLDPASGSGAGHADYSESAKSASVERKQQKAMTFGMTQP